MIFEKSKKKIENKCWFSSIFVDFRRFSQIFVDFRRFSLIFVDFRWFSMIFDDFHWCVRNCWKSWKTRFYVFCVFTSLYRRFRLSRVSQPIDLDEIYRLVSKILNFMPCGSVFDRFCVLWENIYENLWKSFKTPYFRGFRVIWLAYPS